MTQQNTILNKTTPPTPTPTVAVKVATPTLVRRPVPTLKFIEPEDISQYVNMLIIGPHGAGKTLLTTSAAADKRVEGIFYIDVDRGTVTGIDYLRKYREKFKTVYIENEPNKPPDPITDMNNFIRYAQVATNRERAEAEGVRYANMVIIDSASILADMTIALISESEEAITKGEIPRGAKIQEWGTQKSFLESWVNTFKNMPCHLIVTCHEHLGEDEVTKAKVPQLLLPAKLGSKLPALFDEVLWLGVNKKVAPNEDGTQPRSLLCQANKERNAKDRSRKLPPEIPNPTMTTLFNYFYHEA